ncbi:MAG: hypothetical protein HQM06_00755 [Magnetococcales bacterium]|nr:hypothetical protein [Magnetococcales bacterium]
MQEPQAREEVTETIAAPWTSGLPVSSSSAGLTVLPAPLQEVAPPPLLTLSLDTVLTAADIQRLLKVVTSASC